MIFYQGYIFIILKKILQMKITILDAVTLGSDISLSCFEQFGNVEIFDLTAPWQTASRIKESDIVITNKVHIGLSEVENAYKLKLICVAATGYNNIDVKDLYEKNIITANVKGYSSQSVVQLVFAFMLNVSGSLNRYNKLTKEGYWQKSPSFVMLDYPINDLENKTLGIIGCGHIGQKAAKIAHAFDMKILTCGRPGKYYPELADYICQTDLDTLLKQSDFVTIHTPLTDQTKNIINADTLKLMKKTAVLINTSRGGCVNPDHLYSCLKNGDIAAACCDVMPAEPPQNHDIFSLNNFYCTPHIGWASYESRRRLLNGIVDNIKLFIEGRADEIAV